MKQTIIVPPLCLLLLSACSSTRLSWEERAREEMICNLNHTILPYVQFQNASPKDVVHFFWPVAFTNVVWPERSGGMWSIRSGHSNWYDRPFINFSATNVSAMAAFEAIGESAGFEFYWTGGMFCIDEGKAKDLKGLPETTPGTIWVGTSFTNFADVRTCAMAVDENCIFAVGHADVENPRTTRHIRYRDSLRFMEKRDRRTGAVAADFGDNGGILLLLSNNYDLPLREYVALDKKHVYVGSYHSKSTRDHYYNYWCVEKRDKATSRLVWRINSEGTMVLKERFRRNIRRSLADLKVIGEYIYVLGDEHINATDTTFMRLEKRNANTGKLISSFGNEGVVLSKLCCRHCNSCDMAIDGEAIYVTREVDRYHGRPGHHTDFTQEWELEKRSVLTGALDPTFGRKGVIRTDPSFWMDDTPEAVAVSHDSIFVVGYDSIRGQGGQEDRRWRIERRDTKTGLLYSEFAGGGVITTNPSPWHDAAEHIVVDNEYLYISGQVRPRGAVLPDWQVEKRYKRTGALVAEFGKDGVADFASAIVSITIYGDYLYVLTNDRIEKRSKKTGKIFNDDLEWRKRESNMEMKATDESVP